MSEDVFHLGIKGLIRNEDGKILLFQVNPEILRGSKQKSYWDLPGGRVQQGDSVTETLEREIMEETGITKLSNLEHVGMVLSNIRIPRDDSTSFGLILSIYECEVPADTTIKLSDEHIAFEWFTPTKAAALLAVKYPKDFCDIIAGL